MKLNAQKIADVEAWIEKNGLYPQPCGASIADFCKAMDISFNSYQRWQSNENFANALMRAREKFRITTVRDVENALVRAALGADYSVINEERRVNAKTGRLETVKATKKTFYKEPNVEAAKFVLTNMSPDSWKLKQEQTIHSPSGIHIHVDDEAQAAKIRGIADLETKKED